MKRNLLTGLASFILVTGCMGNGLALGLTGCHMDQIGRQLNTKSILSLNWVTAWLQQLSHYQSTLSQDQLTIILIAMLGPAIQLLMIYALLAGQITRRIRNLKNHLQHATSYHQTSSQYGGTALVRRRDHPFPD